MAQISNAKKKEKKNGQRLLTLFYGIVVIVQNVQTWVNFFQNKKTKKDKTRPNDSRYLSVSTLQPRLTNTERIFVISAYFYEPFVFSDFLCDTNQGHRLKNKKKIEGLFFLFPFFTPTFLIIYVLCFFFPLFIEILFFCGSSLSLMQPTTFTFSVSVGDMIHTAMP